MKWHLRRIPRVVHFYWGNDTISFLRYLSVFSFRLYNPDWIIKLYYPKTKFRGAKTWATRERYGKFKGKNYIDKLFGLDVEKIEVDFGEIGFASDVPENYKADFLRWRILSFEGGLWSDIDIIYFKPVADLYFNQEVNKDTELCVCINEYQNNSVGFLLAAPGNGLCKFVHAQSFTRLNLQDYQSMGPLILDAYFPTVASIKEKFPALNVFNFKMAVVYPVHDDPPRNWWASSIFQGSDLSRITDDTIGLHWYAGHPDADEWEDKLTENNFHKFDNVLVKVIGEVMREEDRKKYSIVCTCKIFNELRKGNLERFVRHIKPLVDALVVYDDGSTDGSFEYMLQHTPYVIRGSKNDFLHERVHRQMLLDQALALSPDFILWLDADEVLTANAAEKLQELCAYCDQNRIDGLKLHELNIWRSRTWRRIDSLFNDGWFTRLWRVAPGMIYENIHNPGLHQSQCPSTIRVIEPTHEIKVLHYGFSSRKNLAYKYLVYRSHGQRGYEMLDRLISEEQLVLEKVPRDFFPAELWADEEPPQPLPFLESLRFVEEHREEVFGPKFSIICPIAKSIDWLKFIYEQIFKYTDMTDKEFFFVAGDANEAVLAYLRDRYIPHCILKNKPLPETAPTGGNVYRAYNYGGSKARGDFLVLIHSDMAFAPGWFDHLIKAYDGANWISSRVIEPGRAVSGGHGLIKDFGRDLRSYQEPAFLRYVSETALPKIENRGEFIPLLIRKDHFNLVGGYPEGDIVPGSDIFQPVMAQKGEPSITGYAVLQLRLAAKGIRHQTAFDSLIYHFHGGEAKEPESAEILPEKTRIALCNVALPGSLPASVQVDPGVAGGNEDYAGAAREYIDRNHPETTVIIQDATSSEIVDPSRYTIALLKDNLRPAGCPPERQENNLRLARKLVAHSLATARSYPEYDFEIIPEDASIDQWIGLLTRVIQEIKMRKGEKNGG
ncbi:MAG: glycosyltransferase family 2 protein [Bacillota bacterium]